MIAALRAFSKSWVAAALMGLLILSFAVFGINDAFRTTPSNELVSAGSRKLAPAEYVRIFDSYLKSLEQQAGRPVTRDEAVKENLHIRILNEIASEKAFSALLEKTGIRPSDKLVADQISQQPQFFNAITGKFDKARYEQELAQNNLRPKEFEAYLHDELASSQFGDGIVAGMRAPRIYSAMQVAFGMETRDASVLVLTPAAIAQPAMPTDAQLTAFYKEN
ncbi:MAG: SurA N-terminal domain-containing protein, partial [Asticcacaulis sp.]